jgi:hypothetical protein
LIKVSAFLTSISIALGWIFSKLLLLDRDDLSDDNFNWSVLRYGVSVLRTFLKEG